jgi:citrate lyase subunit beta / citryl-CoA lyase
MTDPASYLFVPGHRPDRFAKAAASGAHRIILDLEDAVGADAKHLARGNVDAWSGVGGPAVVRINGADSRWFEDDLAVAAAHRQLTVMVPKATPEVLSQVAGRLPGRQLIAIVETVEGLVCARDSARLDGVARLAFGNVDFGVDARIPDGGAALDGARFEIVLASRLGNLPPPVDGVTVSLDSMDELDADIDRARRMGFSGKLCIHPRQVEPVNRGFAPTEAEVSWARAVVAALEAASGDVVQVNGKMVDRPMIVRARQILGIAQEG